MINPLTIRRYYEDISVNTEVWLLDRVPVLTRMTHIADSITYANRIDRLDQYYRNEGINYNILYTFWKFCYKYAHLYVHPHISFDTNHHACEIDVISKDDKCNLIMNCFEKDIDKKSLLIELNNNTHMIRLTYISRGDEEKEIRYALDSTPAPGCRYKDARFSLIDKPDPDINYMCIDMEVYMMLINMMKWTALNALDYSIGWKTRRRRE